MSLEYTVSLWVTPVPFPLHFAAHCWLVISDSKTRHRFEVWAPLWVTGDSTVIVDALKPEEGFRTSFFYSLKNPYKKSIPRKIHTVQGTAGSVAHELYDFIKASEQTYPARHRYNMVFGSNSNTYIAWILQHFPTAGFQLPWNAFGKNYKLPQLHHSQLNK